MPLIGHVDEISRSVVTGWAIDTDDPGRPCEVAIRINGQLRAILIANLYRPGLAEALKDSIDENLRGAVTHAHGFTMTFDPPLSVFVEHDVAVQFAGTGTSLARGRKKLPVPNTGRAEMTPVMVTAFGRSGTTILMQLLSRHPGIVVAKRYPFEMKLISYYVAAYRALVSGEDRERSSTPESLVENPFFIGFNPFNRPIYYDVSSDIRRMEEYFEQTVPQVFAESCRTLLMEYYKILRSDQNKSSAAYFAEKVAPDTALTQAARLLCGGARAILLVRDPRDVVASARHFWNEDPRATVVGLAKAMDPVQAMHDERSKDTILVRYKDLIGDTAITMSKVYAFLGLESDIESVDDREDGDLFSHYGTSASPAAFVGPGAVLRHRRRESDC
jgi:hypothetical protein